MVYFITHVEPLHPLRGKEALFFVREQNEEGSKTHVVVKEIPHYFVTPNLPAEEAKRLLTELKKNPLLEQLVLEELHYNQRKSFLRATGSKEHRLIVPEPFLGKTSAKDRRDPLGLNSPSKLLRWAYPPGMMVDTLDKIPLPAEIISHYFVSLDQMVHDRYAILDIEVEDWEIGKDHIYMAVYRSLNKNILLHDLPFDIPELSGTRLQRYKLQQELGEVLTQILQEDDPLWIFGHNIMNYDQLKLRKLTNAYFPAVNHHYPITKSAQGFGRVITKGRWTVDTYGYHFNYLNILSNNSLGTISAEKIHLSYEAQGKLVKEARRGNREAFLTLAHYCLADGVASEQLGRHYQEAVARKIRTFHAASDVVCTTAKVRVADEFWKRRHYLLKGTFDDAWKSQREKELFDMRGFTQRFLRWGFSRGVHDDVRVVHLSPMIAASLKILQEVSPELLARFSTSRDPVEKFDLLQTMNAQLAFVVEQAGRILERERQKFVPTPQLTEKQRAAFFCLFSYHGLRVNPQEWLEGISLVIESTNKALQHHGIINVGNSFHFLRGEVDVTRLENSFYGCYLGKGKALSLREGRVVANPLHENDATRFVYEGFHADHGRKCNFEKRMLKQAIERIFCGDDFRIIEASLREEITRFCSGKGLVEDYFFRVKTRTHYKNLLQDILEEGWRAKRISTKIVNAYGAMKPRINERFSDETRKELRELVAECRDDFSYPFLQEVVEKIEQPYPPSMNLIYAADAQGSLLPISLSALPDLAGYKQKIKAQFEDFFEVLDQRQLMLKL